MKKVIANTTVECTEEGYLTDFGQWNKDIARAIAKEQGIELGDDHWKVIEYLQEKHQKEEALTIRGIKKSGVIDVKTFYKLFPGGPLKKATMIAGIPKPKGCI